jgi:hypothetical protein
MRRKRINNNKKHFTKYFFHQKSNKINVHPKPLSTSAPKPKPKRVFKQLDRDDVIQGMALLIHKYITRYEQFLKPRYQNTTSFPGPRLFNSVEPGLPFPCIPEIKKFIQSIYDKRPCLHVESGIIALILLNRTHIKIHSRNWMRLVLIALLLANKHCEDVYSVYNAKFVGLVPNLENLEINILELEFLKYLKYRLHIETETYDEYYSRLQKFFPMDDPELSMSEESLDIIKTHKFPNLEMIVTSEEMGLPAAAEVYSEMCSMKDNCGDWQDFNFTLVDSIA